MRLQLPPIFANIVMQIGIDEPIQASIQHPLRIAYLIVCAVVLHHFIGMQHIGSNLVAPAGLNVLPLQANLFLFDALLFQVI
jgi:hypothetical protein